MRPLRGILPACVLAFLGTGSVQAAWDNVFQVCCNCGSQPVVSNYAPVPAAAANPCCPPPTRVCTTRYVQRCYYQPVTVMQTKTYYEPVTTYRTSYYWEPVTSYRYSSYYDACSCSYQQVACPTTSYQLRSQCCPVQSWAQRACQVPVTVNQQRFYYEPVTTCCEQPATPCCATAAAPCTATAPPAVPPVGVQEQATVPQSPIPPRVGVRESTGTGTSTTPQFERSLYPSTQPTMPEISGSQTAPTPRVRLDRIVSASSADIQGQVVGQGNQPQKGAKVLFVSVALHGPQQTVSANAGGNFRLNLSAGEWLVYVQGTDGKPVFYQRIKVNDNENRNFRLVSR